jgi:hypothetical protein
MRARRILIAGLAVATLPVLGAGAKQSHRCNPPHSRTVVKGRVGRVYTVPYGVEREVYGCSYETGRRTFLGSHYSDDLGGGFDVAPIVLRGAFVASNSSESGHSTGAYAEVSVHDLRSGKRLHVWADGGTPGDGWTEVTELRLTGSRSAAWIAEVYCCSETVKRVIKADRSRRHARELDHGMKLDPHYLRLSGRRIYWRRDGTTYSAPIR